MNDTRSRTTRRAFFVTGGALIGSSVAAAAGAVGHDEPGRMRSAAADREAIRDLQRKALKLVQASRYDALASLFAPGATAIEALARDTALHTGYRHDVAADADAVTLSEDGTRASATFPVETEIRTPLVGDETIVAMARLQGNWADRRFESGRFEARYACLAGTWMMTSLRYSGA